MADVVVRPAADSDRLDVVRVLDGAMLELDADTVRRRVDAETVLVAADDDRLVGALVAAPHADTDGSTDCGASDGNGAHVEAVAVRRRRRAQGVGSRLVEAAGRRWTPLTADFDPRVKPFYDALGFDCEERGERFRGVLE